MRGQNTNKDLFQVRQVEDDEGHDWQPQEHDYDPEWDYYLIYEYFDHPLIKEANIHLQNLASLDSTPMNAERPGRVFPADLSAQKACAMYCLGTYNEPCILIDVDEHKDYPDQIFQTISHEVKHACQEWQGLEFDEDEAEFNNVFK